jgi:hypothetical protein
MILAILFRPFGFHGPKYFFNLLKLSLPDDGFSRIALCTLTLVYMIALLHFYQWDDTSTGGVLDQGDIPLPRSQCFGTDIFIVENNSS